MESPTVKVTVEVTPVQVEQVAPQITQPTNNVGNSLVGKVLRFHITRPPITRVENELLSINHNSDDAYRATQALKVNVVVPEQYRGCVAINSVGYTMILSDTISVVVQSSDFGKDYEVDFNYDLVIIADKPDYSNPIEITHNENVLSNDYFVRVIPPTVSHIVYNGNITQTSFGTYVIDKNQLKLMNGDQEVSLPEKMIFVSDDNGNTLYNEDINVVHSDDNITFKVGIGLLYSKPAFITTVTVPISRLVQDDSTLDA